MELGDKLVLIADDDRALLDLMRMFIEEEVGARVFLVHTLTQWTQQLKLPRLSEYGISEADLPHIVAHSRGSSMKTNPLVLEDAELMTVLQRRL